MGKLKRGPSHANEAQRFVKMIDPHCQCVTSDDWLIAASRIAEKERISMRELYLEKSGWDTFGEVREE